MDCCRSLLLARLPDALWCPPGYSQIRNVSLHQCFVGVPCRAPSRRATSKSPPHGARYFSVLCIQMFFRILLSGGHSVILRLFSAGSSCNQNRLLLCDTSLRVAELRVFVKRCDYDRVDGQKQHAAACGDRLSCTRGGALFSLT